MSNDVLNHISNWIAIRLELMTNEPNRWVGFEHKGQWFDNAYNQLPTFQEYLTNCVNDNGGKYDFTKRCYSTHMETIQPMSSLGQCDKAGGANRTLRYSCYMGTPFNYSEEWNLVKKN